MADLYLFVPSVGVVLVLLALGAKLVSSSRRKQIALCTAFVTMLILYIASSYRRTEVWCGKTVFWHGKPHPDLSLCTSAVQTNPDDTEALTSRALAYLHLSPPETNKALADLERALQLSQGNQNKIADGENSFLLRYTKHLAMGISLKHRKCLWTLPGQLIGNKRNMRTLKP
jgi:hypothetical protein